MASLVSPNRGTETLLVQRSNGLPFVDRPRVNGVVTDMQFAEQKVLTDWPQRTLNKSISGIVYTSDRLPSLNTTVKLFRERDDTLIATTTTDSSGAYAFPRADDDPNTYYVLAYITTSTPQVHGVSDRGSLPK